MLEYYVLGIPHFVAYFEEDFNVTLFKTSVTSSDYFNILSTI